jgi:CheY-like chemotaxis protein
VYHNRTSQYYRLGVKHVEIVGNDQQAVDREAAEPFDRIFMDVQMPIMDGVEACRRISARRQSNHSHSVATVVFVTAQVSVSFEAECYEAGASDFISKPCNNQSVGACLQQLYGGYKTK